MNLQEFSHIWGHHAVLPSGIPKQAVQLLGSAIYADGVEVRKWSLVQLQSIAHSLICGASWSDMCKGSFRIQGVSK